MLLLCSHPFNGFSSHRQWKPGPHNGLQGGWPDTLVIPGFICYLGITVNTGLAKKFIWVRFIIRNIMEKVKQTFWLTQYISFYPQSLNDTYGPDLPLRPYWPHFSPLSPPIPPLQRHCSHFQPCAPSGPLDWLFPLSGMFFTQVSAELSPLLLSNFSSDICSIRPPLIFQFHNCSLLFPHLPYPIFSNVLIIFYIRSNLLMIKSMKAKIYFPLSLCCILRALNSARQTVSAQ